MTPELIAAAKAVAASLPPLSPEKRDQIRTLLAQESFDSSETLSPPSLPLLPKASHKSTPGKPLPKPITPFSQGVYFLRAGDLIKIGTSGNISQRVKGLQMSSPVPLVLLAVAKGAHEEEHALHLRFSHLREHGEWFRVAPDLIEFIDGLTPRKIEDAEEMN